MKLTRLEKCKIAIEKGITYNPETGKFYGVQGKEIIRKNTNGYTNISFRHNGKIYSLLAHQFGWYVMSKEVVDCLDHINCIKTDNRIDNLRSVTQQENMWNSKGKGYYLNKQNKFQSQIRLKYQQIYLGLFDTEDEARQAYLIAKEKYHIIQPKQNNDCLNGLYRFNQPYIQLTNNYWSV